MTTAAAPPSAELVPLPELPDPDQRGRTSIADRVVEKVAARAVAEVDQATGTRRRLLGQSLGGVTSDKPARASARVDGHVVTVAVSMSVAWPAPIREVTRAVRARVRSRVGDLTGLDVAEVDITVPTLLTERPRAPRVR